MIAVKRETAITHFLRDYCEARRLLEKGQTFSVGRWQDHMIETEQQFHQWFIRGLNLKINTHGGILAAREKVRKWNDDYQVRLWRDQQSLHQILRQRYRIYQFQTQDVRRRYEHLLARYEDD